MKKVSIRSIQTTNWGLALLLTLFAVSLVMAFTGRLDLSDEALAQEVSLPIRLASVTNFTDYLSASDYLQELQASINSEAAQF